MAAAAAGARTHVPRIKLGSQGLEVSVQGLGCMGMSAFYGPPKPEPDMIALIRHAVSSGVTFLDTSDAYGPFTNEILLGKALKEGVREKVELASKFGVRLYEDDRRMEVSGDPGYVRSACEDSLKRLDVECIDLYYQHRIDTRLPIEVTAARKNRLTLKEGEITKHTAGVKRTYMKKGTKTYIDARSKKFVEDYNAIASEQCGESSSHPIDIDVEAWMKVTGDSGNGRVYSFTPGDSLGVLSRVPRQSRASHSSHGIHIRDDEASGG